jgi:predicted nucleic acid-binding protein
MGQRFLIDTNIVIDVLGNVMPDNIKNYISQMPLIVSAVTYIEILGWHKAESSQLTTLVRQQKKIKLGDAIIAATALVHNMALVTRNTSDFKSIDNLQVINPWG